MLKSLIDEILVSEEEIESIVTRLAREISRDYADKNLVLVSVLKGSIMFTIDLAKKLDTVCEMEFVRTMSYGNARRKVEFQPDYVGTVIPDKFVFGYGLDLFEKYRDVPFVAVVSPEYLRSRGL